AGSTHPALVDVEHRVADLYRIINVPTAVWIDENGRIVRPNDAAFGDDRFVDLHGRPAAPHLDALRAWVRGGALPFADDDAVRAPGAADGGGAAGARRVHAGLPSPSRRPPRSRGGSLRPRRRARAARLHHPARLDADPRTRPDGRGLRANVPGVARGRHALLR